MNWFNSTGLRYCAFCRSQRTVYLKRHLSIADILLSVSLGLLLMVAIWQDFDPRVIPMIVVMAGISEFIIQLRWRLGINCPKCGFDPVLYSKSHEEAAKKVKDHLEKRASSSGLFIMPRLPQIQTKQTKSMAPRKRGSLLEKQI